MRIAYTLSGRLTNFNGDVKIAAPSNVTGEGGLLGPDGLGSGLGDLGLPGGLGN
jgi:hypothetical protein